MREVEVLNMKIAQLEENVQNLKSTINKLVVQIEMNGFCIEGV